MTAAWTFLLLFFCNLPFINGQESKFHFIKSCIVIFVTQASLVFVSNTGTLNSRIFCREVIQCVGAGTDVFWSFFGLGSIRLTDTENRFVSVSDDDHVLIVCTVYVCIVLSICMCTWLGRPLPLL